MDHVAENAAARTRLINLVKDLSADQFARPVANDWTVAAVLGHLAFWDRVHVGRLQKAIADGAAVPPALPDGLSDIVNDGELHAWRRLPGRSALDLFESTSREIDDVIAALDPAIVEGVRAAGMPRLVERFRHRNEHADMIEGRR